MVVDRHRRYVITVQPNCTRTKCKYEKRRKQCKIWINCCKIKKKIEHFFFVFVIGLGCSFTMCTFVSMYLCVCACLQFPPSCNLPLTDKHDWHVDRQFAVTEPPKKVVDSYFSISRGGNPLRLYSYKYKYIYKLVCRKSKRLADFSDQQSNYNLMDLLPTSWNLWQLKNSVIDMLQNI